MICRNLSLWLLALMHFLLLDNIDAKIYPRPTALSHYLKNINAVKATSGIALIDQVYVINLDFRKEKWERVNALFKSFGVTPSRFSAIIGTNLLNSDKEKLSGSYPVRMSSGEYGCLLSHISLIRDAYYRDYKIVWICEDDIEVVEDVHLISQYLQELSLIDPDWDVFYTDVDTKDSKGTQVSSVDGDFRPDRSYNDTSYYCQRIPITDNIMRIHQRFGLYSYVLSRKGMKKILDYFTHINLWCPVDIDIHYVPDIKQYSARRDLVSIWYQSPISDIPRSDRPAL